MGEKRGKWLSVQLIQRKDGVTYLHRRFLLPRNRYFNIYLHKFIASDEADALHDHPWHSLSFLIRGFVIEHTIDGREVFKAPAIKFRSANYRHRLAILGIPYKPAITILFTANVIREWGFWCEKGFVRWDVYHSQGGCQDHD